MADLDFKDELVERKMIFQIARKGCGIHRERYVCFFNMENANSISEESTKLLGELAHIHYEADFIVGTSSDENNVVRDEKDDNYYLLESLNDEEVAFLNYYSHAILSDAIVAEKGYEAAKQYVVESLARDNYKRDETTKVSIFQISKCSSVEKDRLEKLKQK